MIRPPRRSVTRFFIPLIDVLILLFCIFLLMPIVEEGSSGPGGEAKLTAGQAQQLRQELDRLRRRVAELERSRPSPRMQELEREVERLREAARAVGERLLIRVFQYDQKKGLLTYREPERVEVRDQNDARRLLDRDRQEAQRNNRELYYLVIVPDPNVARPTKEERTHVQQQWFPGVTVTFDYGQGLGGGRQP